MRSRLCLLILLALVGSASGYTTSNWDNGGTDQLWTTAANWNPNAVPDSDVDAHIDAPLATAANGPVIEATGLEACYISTGATVGAVTLTMNSGSLYCENTFNMSTDDDANTTFNINGGHLIVAGDFRVGYEGKCTLNMTGGKISSIRSFSVAYYGTKVSGLVYLDGGEIHADYLEFCKFAPAAPAKIFITDGILYLTGNKQTAVQGFIDAGYIVYGGTDPAAVLQIEYPVDGNTVVSVYIDQSLASNPNPSHNSTVALADAVPLTWTPGDKADEHKVYFGSTSPPPVAPGQPQGPNSYTPAEALELGKTYYWQIKEVNGLDNWPGPIWDFTVQDHILIDDFESYADAPALTAIWSPGGEAVLALSTDTSHESTKSMKLDFNNNTGTYKSSAGRTPDEPNWTAGGAKSMSFWYKGDPSVNQLYVQLDTGSAQTITDANVTQSVSWTEVNFALDDFGANLTNVTQLTIWIGDGSVDGTGAVYIDDVRLYPARCLSPVQGDTNGDCVVDFRDVDMITNQWLEEIGLWP